MAVLDVKEKRSTAGTGVKAAYGFLGLVLAGYCVLLVLRHTGDSNPTIDGWGVASFEVLVSLMVVARAFVRRVDRAFALLLGLGMCSWAIGDVAMTIENANGTPATLSVANILWYGFFPLAYVGMMLLMRRDVRKFTVANYLDGVIASLVTAAVFWAFAFGTIVKWSGGDSSFAAVNVIYPLGDLLLLALCAIPIFLLPAGKRARWYLLCGACLVNAAGDIAALFPSLVGSHVGYFFNSMAWPGSLFLISCAVWVTRGTTGEAAEHKSSGFAVPAVASVLSLFVLFVSSLTHGGQAAVALASLALLVAGVRFVLALKRLNAINEYRHRQLTEAAEEERRSREALQATVREYSDFASRVADGDLTATVAAAAGSEELGELAGSLNRMVGGLAEISAEIQNGVQNMGLSTAEILAVVSQHTQSANQQSAAIQQTSVTVDELRHAADITATKAEEVAQRARASLVVSDEGSGAVAAIAAAMEDIRDRVDGIAHGIATLSECSQQIGEITATVNGLADRSNLLALNASIEAARAGEHGRGFAVVADQVRSLAEQSKGATAQVESILHDIQVATQAAVQASQQGTAVVAQGIELAGQAGQGIQSLTETIRAASDAAQDIAASVQQQSASMIQIAAAMQEINAGTSHFVEGAEQSQRAAQDLDDLSGKLAALTERYRVG
jgi:methyl-accepting chemotaxis protein